jgi:ATP-dependent helicase IRC3
MTAPELRLYQREAIDAVIAARRAGTKRMVVCLPTGAGKTVIFSHLARLATRQVLVLAHREELLAQAVDKLARALEGTRVVGLERGTSRAPADAKVLVASLRSLHPDRIGNALAGRDIGLIIYDECHHAPADDNVRVLRTIGVFEPDWPGTLLGFTATTMRGDGKGLDSVFERIVYSKTLPDLIESGFLVRLKGFRIATAADLTRLSARGEDFADDELAEAVDIQERNALVARSIQELARDRRTIAFCVTVNHARNLSRALNHVGVPAGIVHGEMSSADRSRVLAEFRDGRISVLANVAVLTEGFDDPGVSCIAMAKPTRSEGLYAQCVGRGTRLAEGKRDCLILDFVDVSELSLCTLPSLFGCPRDLDLRGDDASTAARTWQQIQLDVPALELEADTARDPGASRGVRSSHARAASRRARDFGQRVVLARSPWSRASLHACERRRQYGYRSRACGERKVLGGRGRFSRDGSVLDTRGSGPSRGLRDRSPWSSRTLLGAADLGVEELARTAPDPRAHR